MSTQGVTVNFHYLPLFSVSLLLFLALSIKNFYTLTFYRGGPNSMVGLACALEWLSAMWVVVADPGMVLYCLSLTEVLNLGLTLVSSEVLLSVSGLLLFDGSCVFSAIRLLFFCLLVGIN